jgi:hypothetical protein
MEVKVCWIALVCFVLAGCGSVPEAPITDQKAILDSQPLCCEDFKTIAYEDLPLKTVSGLCWTRRPRCVSSRPEEATSRAMLPVSLTRGVWIKSYFNGLMIKQYLQPSRM